MAGRGYNYYYYFHRETGECRWEYPTETTSSSQADGIAGLDAAEVAAAVVAATTAVGASSGGDVASSPSATVVKKSILKRSSVDDQPSTTTTSPNNTMDSSNNNNINNDKDETSSSTVRNNNKRARVDNNEPREVRVLHILRKHIHSRRPSSWRVPNITDTKEKAISDLLELQSILLDITDPKELRATFEEFAKTESDCSSAKRGGDLGFFGRKKMQPAFEKASFSLGVGRVALNLRILVDADACPVKQVINSVDKEKGISVVMFCDTSHIINDAYSEVVVVDKARDSVDIALINRLKPGDIVVSQDYGVAAMALGKGAQVLNQNGLIYTQENIDILLFERHLSAKVRRSGGRTAGHPKRSKEDDMKFEDALRILISRGCDL
jgi:uncharacterized protein YaiI (UPF0178 family)